MAFGVTVQMSCGHTTGVARPLWKERPCPHCGGDVVKVTAVLCDGEWVPHGKFIALRREAHAADLNVGRKERQRVNRQIARVPVPRVDAVDRELIGWILAASRDQLIDIAQFMWARGYYPEMKHTRAILARVELVDPGRAEVCEGLLHTAEHGITPDRAWYAQYGARAISQEAHGRPTA